MRCQTMKRKLFLLLATLLTVCLCAFTACSTSTPPTSATESDSQSSTSQEPSLPINGVTFSNETYDYDGTRKTLSVVGVLPEGVTVEYSNNQAVDAGVYHAEARLSGEGYETKILNATLTINKIDYDMSGAAWDYGQAFTYDGEEKSVHLVNLPNGVTVAGYNSNAHTDAGNYSASAVFNYDTVNYNAPILAPCSWIIEKADVSGLSVEGEQKIIFDEEKHLPVIKGDLPSGVSVDYFVDGEKIDGLKSIGNHAVKIVLSGKNYNEKIFECTLKISMDFSGLAQKVVDSFGSVPSPWSFLPDTFAPSNRTITAIPNYTDFVKVSSIPVNGIGKQLNVVYDLLDKTTTALSYVNTVHASLNTVKNLYSTYLDENPSDYKNFTADAGAFSFLLALTQEQYAISAQVSNIGVVLFADLQTKGYGAKIQLTPTTILKYTVTENTLLIALDVLDTATTQITFVRKNDVVVGTVYEYLYAADKKITATSALVTVDENYTTLIGTKGDFIPTSVSRNCEVYRNSDGRLVGTEVREELKIGFLTDTYNTLWYNLNALSNVESIKKEDKMNGTNPDTVYINGYSSSISTKLCGEGKKTTARRFDIEFKTTYFYTYDPNEKSYQKIEVEIPMIFIQEEYLSSFESDFYEKNQERLTGNTSLLMSSNDANAVSYGYYILLKEYDLLKDAVTAEDISNYCKA